MMMKNFIRVPAVNFIFNRYGYASDTRDHAIELRIQHRGEKTIFSTGIRVYKRQWDKKNQLVVNRADAVEINKLLEQIRQNVLKSIYAMVEEGNIDIKGIPSRLKALERPKESFVDYCQRRAEVHMHGLKKRTRSNYMVFFRFLEKYPKLHNFSELTDANILALDRYLAKKGMAPGSRETGIHRFFKTFIRDAIADGLMSKNPYDSIRLEKADVRQSLKKRLTVEEVEKIKDYSFTDEKLAEIRDLFIFQTYTCLSVSDLLTFSPKNIQEREGRKVYIKFRTKNDIKYVVPLLPQALEILERYGGKLPRKNYRTYNDGIKEVMGQIIGNSDVTTHWARHTGATLLLNTGVPLHVVSKILGHSKVETTERIYADLLDDTIVREVSYAEKKMSEKKQIKR